MDRRSTRILYISVATVILACLAMGTLRVIRGEKLIGLIILGVGCATVLTPYIHRISGSRRQAAIWVSTLITLLLFGMGTFAGGLYSTSCLWYGPLSVFILLTVGVRACLVWLGLVALQTGLMYWIPLHGFTIHDFSNPALRTLTFAIAGPAGLAFTILMLQGFFESHRRALKALYRQTTELSEAKQAAEAASHTRSDFIATVSHEIRTPMNGILGVAQLLTKTHLDQEQRKYLEAMMVSAEGLLSILNDILDFSKIEAGKLMIRPKTFALEALCRECLALFSGVAQTKNLPLRLELAPDLPANVKGDPVRICQILQNLIGNAMKFTQNGEVVLRVARTESGSGSIAFTVQDTGIGISDADLENMFQAYTQADTATSRQYGGTGLGLAICTRLTQMMAGSLRAESRLGHGSSFYVVLPLPEVMAHMAQDSLVPVQLQASETSEGFQGRSVLLVEDNAVNLLVATKILQQLGLNVESARDGLEGLDRWQSGRYDLVLMDCQMPKMDGYQATREIRQKEAESRPGQRIPILALTAHAMEENKARCLEAGMDGFLTKPINIEALRRALTDWIGRPYR